MIQRVPGTESWYHVGDNDATNGIYIHEDVLVEVEQ